MSRRHNVLVEKCLACKMSGCQNVSPSKCQSVKMLRCQKWVVCKMSGAEMSENPLEMVDDVLTVSKCSITSLTMNIIVNSFMENTKLILSKEKCPVIHVGKLRNKCHKLKVHGRSMKQTDCTKYLGDMIHKSTKVTANLAARLVKAVASFSLPFFRDFVVAPPQNHKFF